MTVNVRLFAGLKHLVGNRDLVLSLPEHATVSTLRDCLVAEYPVLEPFMSTLVCAVAVLSSTSLSKNESNEPWRAV